MRKQLSSYHELLLIELHRRFAHFSTPIAALLIGCQVVPTVNAMEKDEQVEHLFEMAFDELLQMQVTVASGIDESLKNAPAALVVITEQDISQRGYKSLNAVFADLPGFDFINLAGTSQVSFYQRGYRTPTTSRTLIMINGVVDNHLWSQQFLPLNQYSLLNVERIEVLYGPASAVYGANAFMGIVNIITKDPRRMQPMESELTVSAGQGSFDTKEVELNAIGNQSSFAYNLSVRHLYSEGPDMDDFNSDWGYAEEHWLQNENVWGPILDIEHNNRQYGDYYSPHYSWSVVGELQVSELTLGTINWASRSGYGPYYAFDRGQPNAYWSHSSNQFYAKHNKQLNDAIKVSTLFLYRENRTWGDWAEATPDTRPGFEDYSLISISEWNTLNNSTLFKQDYDWQVNDSFRVNSGIKYERKELTKAYDLCGYWADALCSSSDGTDTGPLELGAGVSHSSFDDYVVQPGPLSAIPARNLLTTTDTGIYIQGIYDFQQYRFNAGVRYDENSIYGSTVNPRLSAIYHFSDSGTVKLLYGEAFQEPSAQLLFGGWNGRNANPELEPEEAKNLELIVMYQTRYWLHDVSLFASRYNNVIKEESENAGKRDIQGLEYRGRYQIPNAFQPGMDITGYVYYTYTRSISHIYYDHEINEWLDGDTNLGDIAPHKIHAGVNLPIRSGWNLNLRARHISDLDLYSRNPLRAKNEKLSGHTPVDANLTYQLAQLSVGLSISNLFDESYYYPGTDSADSGDDFENRSQGFTNSLLIQTGRSYHLSFVLRM